MKKILPLIAGLSVNKAIEIYEGFFVQVDEAKNRYSIVANIGAPNLTKVIIDLIKTLGDDLTFIVEHKDQDSKLRVFKERAKISDWNVKELDWILQDGFTSLRVQGDADEEVFAGPLQVCYVNTRNLKVFKQVLKHWFVRQQTHLNTMYSIAQADEFEITENALKLDGQNMTDFLTKRFKK